MKSIQKLWHRNPTGILVPAGYASSSSHSGSDTYIHIKGKALELEDFYKNSGVRIPEGSGLALLIASAKELSDAWLCGRIDDIENDTLWRAAHLNRISDSILALKGDNGIKLHLRKLTNGNLDLLKRDRTEAKDFLWEIELLHGLREHGVSAVLEEPPDIVAHFRENKIGIACKKVYKENNFEKVLSEGVAQIEKKYKYGIVAINIDELTPPNSIQVENTQEEMARRLDELNLAFMHRHKKHFKKYLSAGRLLSALVSTAVLADLRGGGVRLNNARQSGVWIAPDLSQEGRLVFKSFYNKMMA